MKSKASIKRIIETLKTLYPDGLCSLQYEKDYELLFAVRLSAQCTDERVRRDLQTALAVYTQTLRDMDHHLQEPRYFS